MAFMMGKLRVAGDMGLAMKLQAMFPGQAQNTDSGQLVVNFY